MPQNVPNFRTSVKVQISAHFGAYLVTDKADSKNSSTTKKIFVRLVTNFVIGDEWFCSAFKLKMGDSFKMV